MKQQHPVVERYVAHLEAAIGGLDAADRREVLQEIRNHIAEATAAGRPLDVVIESLGPADALGRAYAVELLLHPQNDRPRHAAERWFRIVGLVVVLSIPTLVAMSTLGSVGISFVASGLFTFVVGVLEAAGVFPWPHLIDLPPVVAIFLGPAMLIVGAVALVALRFYIRFVVRAVRISRGTHPQRRHPDRWRQDHCRGAPLVRAGTSRDQRHRLHRIDDCGWLLEQPSPLPRTKVDRCRNAPCVRA